MRNLTIRVTIVLMAIGLFAACSPSKSASPTISLQKYYSASIEATKVVGDKQQFALTTPIGGVRMLLPKAWSLYLPKGSSIPVLHRSSGVVTLTMYENAMPKNAENFSSVYIDSLKKVLASTIYSKTPWESADVVDVSGIQALRIVSTNSMGIKILEVYFPVGENLAYLSFLAEHTVFDDNLNDVESAMKAAEVIRK